MPKTIALHTSEVSVGDNQSENEAEYNGYKRITPEESGWVYFPSLISGEGEYYTHVSASNGNGKITGVMELSPLCLGQINDGPVFNVSKIL